MTTSDDGLQIGRAKKARRLAAAIRSLGGTAAEARTLTEAEWGWADQISLGYKVAKAHHRPPSPETRALVIAELASDPMDSDVPPDIREIP